MYCYNVMMLPNKISALYGAICTAITLTIILCCNGTKCAFYGPTCIAVIILCVGY